MSAAPVTDASFKQQMLDDLIADYYRADADARRDFRESWRYRCFGIMEEATRSIARLTGRSLAHTLFALEHGAPITFGSTDWLIVGDGAGGAKIRCDGRELDCGDALEALREKHGGLPPHLREVGL